MKEFKTILYDANKVRKELKEFDKLLKSQASLSEQKDLQPFFKKREQLCAFMGTYTLNIGPGTHLAYEFPFLGDFAADIIVGNRDQGEYLVIELEDGTSTSVFTKLKGKQTKEWSKRFDHGYSQLIDWFSCLDDYRQTGKFIDEFGHGYVTFYGLLIVGRNSGMTDGDRRRLKWRTTNVVVHSQPITCITFDDLYDALQRRLTLYTQGATVEKP
jgi:Domain of unknown function (DUF4263)